MFVLSLLLASCALGLQLDIHLVPSPHTGAAVTRLARMAPHNQIDFVATSQAHVTLYLTDFVDAQVSNVLKAAQQVLTQAARLQEDECSVLLRGMTVGAGYAMWNVKVAPCLQQLSDAVVRATYQFAKANQTVPSWVYSLPPAERKAKIDMVRRYGSPNVFAQFEPHLTVAYDTADNLTQIYGAVNAADAFPAEMVGISRVGPFGTVLKNGQLSSFSLQQDEGAKSSSFSQDYCRPSENNDWDYFLLVREWPGTMTPGALPSYINTFTLHGLWPNRNDGSWPECCNNSYPFQYSQIAPIIQSVERVWYDTMHDQTNATSFWGHEWDKHGTCWAAASGGNERQYFQMCIDLHDAMTFAVWLAQANIVPADPSQTMYQKSDFVAAIQKGLGFAPLLKCTNLNGNTVIQNLGACVNKNRQVMQCPDNQIATWQKDENCGDSFGYPTIPH